MSTSHTADTPDVRRRAGLHLRGLVGDHLVLIGLIGAFLLCALPRLTSLPRVNVDEPWMMQLAWQLRTTGDITLPMFGFNQTFLLQPGYSLIMAPWMALVGSGIYEARLLSVLLGTLTLLLVFRAGALLQGKVAGLAAVALLSMDSNFLGAVRSTRHDIMSLAFLVSALVLLLEGRRTGRPILFFASGLASGIALIFHANAYWGIAVAGVWLLVINGWRILVRPDAYLYGAGVFVTLIPLLLRFADYRRQLNRFVGTITPSLDPAKIAGFIAAEPERYRYWYFGLVTVPQANPWLLIFQVLLLAGLLLLIVRVTIGLRRRASVTTDALIVVHVLISAFLFAGFVPNKAVAYLPHLLVGFAWTGATAFAAGHAWISAALDRAGKRQMAHLVMAATLGLYVVSGVVHYHRWFRSATTAMLVPYADTASTIEALLPPGPRQVIAFPTFWLPFKDDSRTTFYSVSAIAPPGYDRPPIEGFQTAISADALRGEPVYVVFDEAHWLPMLSVKAPYQLAWIAFLRDQCALQATAASTAYGAMASYVCSLEGEKPPVDDRWIAAPGRRWVVDQTVWASAIADPQSWELYRLGGSVPRVDVVDGSHLAIKGGPGGVCRSVKVTRGGSYVLAFEARGADARDLLSLGHAASLRSADDRGAASPDSALWHGLMEQGWYPQQVPFEAVADEVRLCFYSETDTSFTLGPVQLRSLKSAPAHPNGVEHSRMM